ncbi:hypothetical protein [Myroides marinus]|uniref:hypothetical protein n=1 Tax=Myroides marinus TaxID=703342 RepID=UPI0007422859|nr:hypothetical protein [Myroides marinus]KUF40891.1 hypothetical protein AS361_07850 [Myroides marinus]MDM1355958.1 hypothetical protein [Myroides marinus]MDM1367994.1 hypothetical protein [Myroides marinus]MDM1533779.1 hypothetical protein [Myroides marinus]MDM1540715.1 hypothetical protein [Myroides marinus]
MTLSSSRVLGWSIGIALLFLIFFAPAFCPLILGSLMVYYTVHYALFLRNISKYGKEDTGKIVSYQKGNKGYKVPLIEFEINGTVIVKTPYFYASTDLSKLMTYSDDINKSIGIIYDPKDFEKFVIKSKSGFNNLVLLLFGMVGLLFIVIGLAQLLNVINIDGL